MSKIQDVKSSIANEAVMEADKKLILADDESHCCCHQPEASATMSESTTDESVDKTHMENIVMASETIGKATSNNEKSLNINTDETIDESATAKTNEAIEKSVSGECRNILPVLVEHLRSALEFSSTCTIQNQNIPDDSHVPNDFTTKPTSYQEYSHRNNDDSTKSQPPLLRTMDLNFFEDLLLSDIKTALSRLQDMLSRVDLDAISRYSSSLEPNDKLHLLQLISNLVSNLKMVKSEDSTAQALVVTNKMKQNHSRGRNRHTIGVSSEELARARKWLEERGSIAVNTPIISSTLSARNSVIIEPQSVNLPQQENVSLSDGGNLKEQSFDNPRKCEKHMKDAINQQQSLQNRSRDKEIINNSPIINVNESTKLIPDISNCGKYKESDVSIAPVSFLTKPSNKFTAKKSKLKRANTIDIPNYIKLQTENNKLSSSPGLRRPIDISDRLSWNPPQITNMSIPSFEPKTENDRKFLALINRNNETNNPTISGHNSPFKSFNYRQTSSIADENWKSRFSNIKTTFDKVSSSPSASPSSSSFRKNSGEIKSFNKNHPKDYQKEPTSPSLAKVIIKNPFSREEIHSPTRKFPAFTHAASSPFKKIQTTKNIIKEKPTSSSSSSGYLPACATSGMLRAKLKIFDNPTEQINNNLSSRDIKPMCPNFTENYSNNYSKINSFDNSKIHPRNPNSLGFNDNSRRNSGYEEMIRRNKGEMEIQRRQSVAVQTMNYPMKMKNENLMMDLNNDDKTEISQLNNSYLNQQSSKESSEIAGKNCYLSNEIENPIYVSPETIPPTHLHVLIVNNLSHAARTNGIGQLSCNYDGNVGNINNSSSENEIDNENVDSMENNDDSTVDDCSFMDDKNIENQDISDNGIVTRYTSAIVTLEKSPSPPRQFSPILSRNSVNSVDEQSNFSIRPSLFCPGDHVQRHNMLQQRLMRRLQLQDEESHQGNRRYSTLEVEQKENLPISSRRSSSIDSDYELSKPLIENNNTQDKINLFEGKFVGRSMRNNQKEKKLEPVIPKIYTNLADDVGNIANSSATSWPQVHDYSVSHLATPSFRYQTGPGDSSDEYLVSCASQPHRSIVLSKSESWHQLAMSKNHLSVPQEKPQRPQYRPPPKINPHSLKHTEGLSTDNLKKMEEKVQRYFHSGNKGTLSSPNDRVSVKSASRRSFSPKKNQGTLARSHTMPHVYDELNDIDKQFDSLFEETTYDKRHLI